MLDREQMETPTTQLDPYLLLMKKSIKWRTAAGWIVVLILAWRYLVHPAVSTYMVATGHPPLPSLDPLSLADVLAVVGLPVGGAVADRMSP